RCPRRLDCHFRTAKRQWTVRLVRRFVCAGTTKFQMQSWQGPAPLRLPPRQNGGGAHALRRQTLCDSGGPRKGIRAPTAADLSDPEPALTSRVQDTVSERGGPLAVQLVTSLFVSRECLLACGRQKAHDHRADTKT